MVVLSVIAGITFVSCFVLKKTKKLKDYMPVEINDREDDDRN